MCISPKISVVLPTFNGERWLADAIQSVLVQSEVDWELIVVDDFSSDASYEIANSFALRDPRIRIIRNASNKKLPASLNIGFSQARGKYFSWTSDDNLYKPDALDVMMRFLEVHPDIDLAAFNMDMISDENSFLHDWKSLWPQRNAIDLSYGSNVGAAFIYHRRVLSKIGIYDESMFCAEDYEYWVRIALNGKIGYSDERNIYQYRIHENSLTHQKENIVRKKTAEIQEKYFDEFVDKFDLNIIEASKVIYRSQINGFRLRFMIYWPVLMFFKSWELFLQVVAFSIYPKDKHQRRKIRKFASRWLKPKSCEVS